MYYLSMHTYKPLVVLILYVPNSFTYTQLKLMLKVQILSS